MGITKTESFTTQQNELANILKALAHPARVAIIDYLLTVDECICSDIVNELPLAQPTVSQHLKELKNAGIIKGSIDGKSICYCIDEKKIIILREYLDAILLSIKQTDKICQ
ncbi:MAG: metalloregulator ArsR/SmtB family transcription factor [Spirosomaceae bacterium]|jgi:DNA-binding transcriptional ArsR family regulator|nr:metalloregulator ArsR/SmtB family transcription factor [Spirosomataceae bacterium]